MYNITCKFIPRTSKNFHKNGYFGNSLYRSILSQIKRNNIYKISEIFDPKKSNKKTYKKKFHLQHINHPKIFDIRRQKNRTLKPPNPPIYKRPIYESLHFCTRVGKRDPIVLQRPLCPRRHNGQIGCTHG